MLRTFKETSSAQQLQSPDIKGEQAFSCDSYNNDDVKEYSIFEVLEDPTELKVMCGALINVSMFFGFHYLLFMNITS